MKNAKKCFGVQTDKNEKKNWEKEQEKAFISF